MRRSGQALPRRTIPGCVVLGCVLLFWGVPICRGQDVTIAGIHNVTQNLDTLYSGAGERTALVSSDGTVDVPVGEGNGVYAGNFGFWTLTNAGVVRGDSGVSLGLGGSVTNQNEILGRSLNGAGVFLANGGGANTVVNESTGTITGGSSAAVGGMGVYLLGSPGDCFVDNSGQIRAYGDGGSRGTAALLQGGGAVVNRSGGVITGGYGGTSGLGVYLFGPGSVENSGAITGNNYQGVAIAGDGTVINHTGGTITGNGATIGVWINGGEGTVVNEADAAITGGRNGVVVSGPGLVLNYGTITGQNAGYYGVRFSNTNAGYYETQVVNEGDISGGAAGVSVRFMPGSGTSDADTFLVNKGTITTTGPAGTGVSVEGNGAFANDLINFGTIGGARGVLLDQGATGTFVNDLINLGTIQGTTNPGIDVRGTAYILNAGTISGKTGILLANSGSDTVTNAGAIVGTGGVAVDLSGGDDAMTLIGPSTVTGKIDGGAGTDALILLDTGTIGIDQITHFESVAKEGTGTWTLTGTGSSGGPIAVNEGTLNVAGNVGDPVNVGSLGALKGNGSVGTLTDNGLVAPGNSIGTLAVRGDFVLDDPGILEIEIGGFDAGESDFLDVAGKADLLGGMIELLFLDGYDIASDLLAGETDSVMFLEVDSGIAALASTITYGFLGTPAGFTYDVFIQGDRLWFQATNTNGSGPGPGPSPIPAPAGIVLVGIGFALVSGVRLRRTA